MNRSFSMLTVLRRTPFRALRWFLPKVGLDLGLDLKRLRACDLPQVISAYQLVSPEKRREIETIVEDIVSLANQEGIAALRESARLNQVVYWDVIFRPNASAYLQSIWAWSSERKTFEQAKKFLHANQSVRFCKRIGLPHTPPLLNENKIAELKDAVQNFFVEHQHRGEVCTVDAFERGNGKYSILVYPDDYERAVLRHDEQANLIPSMDKPVFEIFFDIDSTEGSLSVSAKLSKQLREQLEDIFIRIAYEIEPPVVSKPKYDLEKLKDSNFILATDPDDCVTAEISFMNLFWIGINSSSSFKTHRRGDIFVTINQLLKKEKRSLVDAAVQSAAIRFHFLPKADRRAGVVCVELSSSNNIVIRCKDVKRVEVMHKYLKRWEIELCNQN
ncbi:MAG: hypothetical protein LBB88_06800 [Planctomycetaceae bacterium]|nr:hypothetical protein [Planctomycetaceae bacterium]